MTPINCFIAPLNANLPCPPEFAQRLPYELGTRYAAASGGAVNLLVHTVPFKPILGRLDAVSPAYLHQALAQVTHNAIDPPNIAVLYASHYALPNGTPMPGMFGLMFDRGGILDPAPTLQPPRLGCAVFFDAIAQQRVGNDFIEEAIFVTLHEIGHIFNLWHIENTPNIMMRSQDHVFPESAWQFMEMHAQWLKGCFLDDDVTPGRSNFDGQGGTADDSPPTQTMPEDPSLKAVITTSPAEFWYFEPIHLDLTLTAVNGTISIPDHLDPGYDSFRILIENPRGERKILRPPLRFCTTMGNREVNGSGYSRDIPIFIGAGGYTFRHAGEHRINLQILLRDGRIIRSNTVRCFVRPDRPDSKEWQFAYRLKHAGMPSYLYYSRHPQTESGFNSLDAFLADDAHTALPSSALLKYLWARGAGKPEAPSRGMNSKLIRKRLMTAAEDTTLGDHRRARAETMLRDQTARTHRIRPRRDK